MKNNYFQLINSKGLSIGFTNIGGRIHSIIIPAPDGTVDILVGASKLDDYLEQDEYMGAICGRSANRIEGGTFQLAGRHIQLSQNAGMNHLHGGFKGFHSKYWSVEELENQKKYRLACLSYNDEEGYPGNLRTTVTYSINDENEFEVRFFATTDQATIVNLTSHPYFNLKGHGSVLDHYLWVNANYFTPLNSEYIPSGEIKRIDNTGFDFRDKQELESLFWKYQMVGIDQNLVLENHGGKLDKVAVLSHKETNRSVEILSTQPGLQVYTGLHFNNSMKGKDGKSLQPNMGIALEPQKLPNTPNEPKFGSTILLPGQEYEHRIIYKFNF